MNKAPSFLKLEALLSTYSDLLDSDEYIDAIIHNIKKHNKSLLMISRTTTLGSRIELVRWKELFLYGWSTFITSPQCVQVEIFTLPDLRKIYSKIP